MTKLNFYILLISFLQDISSNFAIRLNNIILQKKFMKKLYDKHNRKFCLQLLKSNNFL